MLVVAILKTMEPYRKKIARLQSHHAESSPVHILFSNFSHCAVFVLTAQYFPVPNQYFQTTRTELLTVFLFLRQIASRNHYRKKKKKKDG